ncbi:hypothetical protein ASPACDRAFT_124848 [Aspergillus aculeatus ATCC 16872]|uniref:CCHC-type domain-containing protein n=1 Tax=Aspergillus aculeatus (strain ATCC 16872 / CBS 172.66 / WB 5094) TaxID=690307 RepID=A0A1L9WL43_ASPA1|nr:uncharacterized protein ASPACDRAFT_124848 [Aspergillus aculeatus ATCC 16872]OJJ96874.1 hypothetical protein ASPACDRAFT_124848 [Aspergillus aculeatus ATCC 16872]
MRKRKSSCHRYILLHLPVIPPTVAMIVNHLPARIDPPLRCMFGFYYPDTILIHHKYRTKRSHQRQQQTHLNESPKARCEPSTHTLLHSIRPSYIFLTQQHSSSFISQTFGACIRLPLPSRKTHLIEQDNHFMDRCENCGGEGHPTKECPVPRCYTCLKLGHLARACPDQICRNCHQRGHEARDCTETKQ